MQRFRDMLGGDPVFAGEVRDRAGDFARPVIAARRQPESASGHGEKAGTRHVELAITGDQRRGQLAVATDAVIRAAEPLALARRFHSSPHNRGRLALRRGPKAVWRHSRYVDGEIQAIAQRAGEPRPIPVDLRRRAVRLSAPAGLPVYGA